MKKRAFTLIEIIFVIVILGVLSAIAIPKLFFTRSDAIVANAKTQTRLMMGINFSTK